MRKQLGNLKANLRIFGFDFNMMKGALRGLPLYLNDYKRLKMQKGNDSAFPFGDRKLMLTDRFAESGSARGHYFHQDLLVAQRIFEANPVKHVDIGSRIDGFIAHVASFREVEVFDIREMKSASQNIIYKQADLIELPDGMMNYCDSISALHSIEHFGLGRYGDPIDYHGHTKAIENISKILKPGGTFYFSVPVGPQRIEFNAHRVFSLNYLSSVFSVKFEIVNFSYVDDRGDLYVNQPFTGAEFDQNYGCIYGCGIFELLKK
jgi:SAM-dependent methyltransferase